MVLKTTTNTVEEGDRVELCAVVSPSDGNNSCPVAFDFTVTISSRGASAGAVVCGYDYLVICECY